MQISQSIYIVPPVLSVTSSVFMALAAVYKKGLKKDHYLFAMVCIWHAVMPATYLTEHMVDDPSTLLVIEQAAHFLYAFYPLILLLFFQRIFGKKHVFAVASCVVLSIAFAFIISAFIIPARLQLSEMTAHTRDLANRFQPALILFSIYGATVLIYIIICFNQSIKNETNPVSLLKKQYMLFSFSAAGILILLNMPSAKNMGLYPLGNYSFIPMMVLGYGVLKYRLLDIKIAFNLTAVISVIVCSVFVLNYIIFKTVWVYLYAFGLQQAFIFFIALFFVNLVLIVLSRAVIFKLFYRSVQQLKEAEADLIIKIKYLKNINVLFHDIAAVMKKNLRFESSMFYLRSSEDVEIFENQNFVKQKIELPVTKWLATKKKIIERSIVQTHPKYIYLKPVLVDLFDRLDCHYIVPLILENELTGLLCFPARHGGKLLSSDESLFVNNIANATAIAIFNATIYKYASDIKDRLEKQTIALKHEVEQRKKRENQLEAIRQELEKSNMELEHSILQANEMTSRAEQMNYVLEMEMKERKSIELALRRNEEKYRLIAENTSDVIWTMNLDLQYTFVSPSVYQLRGVTVKEAMAQKLSEFLTPDSLEKIYSAVKEEIEQDGGTGDENQYRILELELKHKNGSVVWAESTMTLLRGEDGKPREVLGVTRNITERKKAEKELVYVAFHDSLTGLNNRSAFIKQLESEIAFARRSKTQFAVLFIDLDRFKEVNDTYGHETGDFVLKEVAGRLVKAVREVDYVARLGGDEFTIILRGLEDTHPEVVHERIMKSLSNPFFFRDIKIDFLAASIGISIYPDHGDDVQSLLTFADDGMYKEKAEKRAV